MKTIEDAIILATTLHAGQVDKLGAPYILHPLRVMLAMDPLPSSVPQELLPLYQQVAVLHDVLEDTPATLNALRAEGYADAVVKALDAITRRMGERYMEYIGRVSTNRIARYVKLCDLEDNLNRSTALTSLTKRYVAAREHLLEAAP